MHTLHKHTDCEEPVYSPLHVYSALSCTVIYSTLQLQLWEFIWDYCSVTHECKHDFKIITSFLSASSHSSFSPSNLLSCVNVNVVVVATGTNVKNLSRLSFWRDLNLTDLRKSLDTTSRDVHVHKSQIYGCHRYVVFRQSVKSLAGDFFPLGATVNVISHGVFCPHC